VRSARLLVAAAVVAAGLATAAGPARAQALRERLPGGFTTIVRAQRDAPVVAVSLFVRGGSRWDPLEQPGLSNLLHQVMVKGTTSRSALELAEAAEDLGGSIGAATEPDSAEIRGTALAQHWRALVALLAEVVLAPALREADVESERRAVLSQIRSRRDQPFPRAFDALTARLFGEHPYGRSPLGTEESVRRLTRADFATFHARIYRADRVVASVVGQINAAEVQAELARALAALPPGDGKADEALAPVAAVADRVAIAQPAAQAQILVGAVGPPVAHADYAVVKVLVTALGGGMSGRLFTELRDKQGLAYATGALYPTRAGQGPVVAYLGTAPANAERAEEGMLAQIARLRGERLPPEELARAKGYLLGQFAMDRRTSARIAWYQGFFELAGVGADFPERYVRAVNAVTADDVQRAAARYLSAPVVVSLRPPAP